jgi:hypothetical protein
LACDISAEQEEPWRRLLQELSEAGSKDKDGYLQSRRRLGVSAESVWLVPTKPRGGGVAVVCLQADNPEQVLGELAGSEAPFNSWYGGAMGMLFDLDLAQVPRGASGELLFAWRDDDARDEREASKSP